MRADLHIHSVFSDGAYSPETLAKRCKEAGLGLFALTDHDNMEGCAEAAAAAERYGLAFVRGWEVSAYAGEQKVHVLGYGCTENGAYRAFCAERALGGLARAEEMLRKANEYFSLSLSMEDVERYHLKKEAPVHTMHVVNAFAEALGADRGELYRKVFARGGPAFSSLFRPTPEEALAVIRQTGGIAVLAHPGRIPLPARREIADRLVRCGLDGIECFYTTHTVTETAEFLGYARARHLAVTGGSDFHTDDGVHILGMPAFDADGLPEQILPRERE